MNKVLRILIILFLISIDSLIIKPYVNIDIIKYIKIILISVFVFLDGNECRSFKNEYLLEILKLFIIYLFWNISYIVISKGIFINNSEFNKIIIDTILLKNVIFDLFVSLFICNIFKIILKKKKIIPAIETILIILFIFLRSEYLIYVFIFNLGLNVKRIRFKTINYSLINLINESYVAIIIVNKFLLYFFTQIHFINNIYDVLGIIFLSYLLGTIIKLYFRYIPIVRKLI